MGIFDKRVAFKPFEYPEASGFVSAIRHSYWIHTEWSFMSDVQDFHVNLNDSERDIIKKTLLAISQIEVSVKSFWGNIDKHFPKPEFQQVGATFAESEVRHADAYSHLLEVLGFNQEFDQLLQNQVIQGRVDYLTKYLKGASENSNQNYTLNLALFSLFIENVSLFSQFAIVKSFNKFKNMLKDIDNVIFATSVEETIHFEFGAYLINKIKEENPQWFDDEFYAKLTRACKKAYEAESKIIDWIFENGELEFMPKETLKTYIKHRFNISLAAIGSNHVFEIDDSSLKDIQWLNEEFAAQVDFDFFNKKPTTYSKKTKSITADDLF